MVDVQLLDPDGWRAWRAVRLAALADSPEAFGDDAADWIAATERQWRERLATFAFRAIALDVGAPVGQVAALPPEADGGVKLVGMWVSPTARGRGIGATLVDVTATWARSRQASEVFLFVKPGNFAARDFYLRLGVVRAHGRVSQKRSELEAYTLTRR